MGTVSYTHRDVADSTKLFSASCYPNYGKIWSALEDKELLLLDDADTSLQRMSELLGRTPNGIIARLCLRKRYFYDGFSTYVPKPKPKIKAMAAEVQEALITKQREEREQWLFDQYVLTLRNNSVWHFKAWDAISSGSVTEFTNVTIKFANRIARNHAETLTQVEFEWIKKELLTDMNCNRKLPTLFQNLLDEISNHMTKAEECLAQVENNFQTTLKENTMASKAFDTRTYVYGKDTGDMTVPELIGAIKQAENEIAALNAVKTPSAKIKALIADLESQLANIVSVLDAR